MKIAFVVLLAIVSCEPSFAQAKTGDAKSEGTCSPAVTGDKNTFIFRYCGSDPEEEKRIFRLLKAVAQGESLANGKLDEILEILNKSTKITILESLEEAALPGKNPRTSVTFYSDDPVDRGQFEVVCDRACTPVAICPLIGGNASRLAAINGHPEIVEFLFQRQFPSLTRCKLTVESRDDKAVEITSIKVSNRIMNLDFNIAQPGPFVSAGGTVIR